MSENTCRTCPWWEKAPDSGTYGGCHFAPPVGDRSHHWPEVGRDDWCSNHPNRIYMFNAELKTSGPAA